MSCSPAARRRGGPTSARPKSAPTGRGRRVVHRRALRGARPRALELPHGRRGAAVAGRAGRASIGCGASSAPTTARPPTSASSPSPDRRTRPSTSCSSGWAPTPTSARCSRTTTRSGERERPVVGVETPGMAPLVSRITLTLPVVNRTRAGRVPGHGRGQGRLAVARAFSGRPDPRCPGSLVEGPVTVLLDPAAAAPPVSSWVPDGARREPVPADRGVRLPVRLRDLRARRAERRTSSGSACRASTRRASSARCSTATPACSGSDRRTSRCRPPRRYLPGRTCSRRAGAPAAAGSSCATCS